MDTLDTLLRQAADAPPSPPGFTGKVMQRIERLEENKELRSFCYAGLGMSAGFLGLSISLSVVIADTLDGFFADVLGAMMQDPSLFASSEGWNALLETISLPLVASSIGFLVLTAASVRPFFRRLPRFLPSSLRYAHT